MRAPLFCASSANGVLGSGGTSARLMSGFDGIAVEVDPERGLDFLSPASMARVEVLKGPPETTMYGVRGANGVILITTKH